MKRTVALLIAGLLMATPSRAAPAAPQKPRLAVQTGHSSYINAVAFSPDGRILASAGVDQTIKLWDVARGLELRSLRGHTSAVQALAFSADGRLLASGGTDAAIKIWEVETGSVVRTLEGHQLTVTSVAFSSDGLTLASGAMDQTIRIWSMATGRLQQTMVTDDKAEFRGDTLMALSRDGRTLASGGEIVRLWDASSTGRETRALTEHPYPVYAVAFSPDGRTLASSGLYQHVQLWDFQTGRLQQTLRTYTDSVNIRVDSLAFSSDGRLIAGGSEDGTIRFWDAGTAKLLATLLAFDERDWLVVSPDGLFDGSPAAWSQMLWRFSPQLFDVAPVEIFFNEYYYPGLLAEFFSGRRPVAASNIEQKDRRQPQLKISAATDATTQETTARVVKVNLDITAAPAGAAGVLRSEHVA